jgi:crotonobetaine/carnitine-CoA ligase
VSDEHGTTEHGTAVHGTLVDILLAAESFGERPCFLFIPDGQTDPDQSIDYATFFDRALRLAGGLQDRGVGPGTIVAFVASPRLEYLLTMAAVTLAGGVLAPVNHLFKRRELIGYLGHLQVAHVVVDEQTAPLLAEILPELPGLELLISTTKLDEQFGAVSVGELEQHERAVPAAPGRDDLAVLMHTSGTTGLPKAVIRSHAAYHDFAHVWTKQVMRPHDRIFSFMPMYHQAGYLCYWLPAMLLGLPFFQMERFSPVPFWATIRKHGLTHGLFMPPVPAYVLARPESEDAPHPVEWAFGLSSADVWKRFQERFGIPLHGGYGSTETTIVGLSGVRADSFCTDEALDAPLGGSVMGKPIPDWVQIRIADEHGAVQPHLTTGEVQMTGPGVTTGYYRNPQATAAAFTPDGWFRTGDIGYSVEDGRFFWVDRSKNLIRRSGENIAPAELEEVLTDHPGIHEAAVLPVPDDLRGEEIRACIVRSDVGHVSAEEIFAYCAEQVAAFKVPRYIEFFESFPHTPTFKIQKEPLLAATDRENWIDRLH